jgi:hypothetical protein
VPDEVADQKKRSAVSEWQAQTVYQIANAKKLPYRQR